MFMGTKVLSIALLSLSIILFSPTFALNAYTSFGIYGSNNSMVYNSTFTNYGFVNGSQICTPANGLCNSTGGTGGSGYNTSDGTWIYNGTSGLTFNQTTGNATYQRKITNNCTGDDYIKGGYSNGTPICGTPTDTNTMYTSSGSLLQLGGTIFSIREGNLTEGGFCRYNSSIGLWCNTTLSLVDTNDTTAVNALQSKTGNISGTNCSAGDFFNGWDTNSKPVCSTPSGSGDITSVQSYDNLIYNGTDSGDVKLRVNMTYFNLNASYVSGLANGNWSADKGAVIDNASRYYGSNTSLITTSNGTWVSGAVGNYSSVQSALYTNITTALGYYANSSLGASLYTNASSYPSVASALYTNITQAQGYYTNASQGATAYTWANANHTNWDYAYSHITDYYANASRYYGTNKSLILDSNGTWISGAVGNYSSVASELYTNITTALGFYTNASLGASYYANSSLGASLYTNASRYYGTNTSLITTLNMTTYMASTNWTMTNMTLSEAGHTLKSYWNGTMWIEVVT